MFLEIWMIVLVVIVFGIALLHLYHSGYNDGYKRGHVEGGVFTFQWIMSTAGDHLGKDGRDKLSEAIISESTNQLKR